MTKCSRSILFFIMLIYNSLIGYSSIRFKKANNSDRRSFIKYRSIALKKNRFIILLFVTISTLSCWSDKKVNKEDLLGEYLFTYPSKEIEVVFLLTDSTYKKDIYKNLNDYKRKSNILYTNRGKWSVNQNKRLNFDNWLLYNYYKDPKIILDKPYLWMMKNVTWVKPGTDGRNALLDVLYETDYIFERVEGS